eukprot:scaffold109365_cov33-Phaeocystis_antarctica.AAC.2
MGSKWYTLSLCESGAGEAGEAEQAERSGAERSGAERSGVERSGAEWSGAGRSASDRRNVSPLGLRELSILLDNSPSLGRRIAC